ncbi:MAG: DsbA family protein [Armatimonadetes bacterium]|nr:DsbA family protein [Armatimonadota bacterium]
MASSKDLTVTIAHDYLCPWCWVGFFHAKKLREEFPQITLDWRGYELLPEELGPLPDYKPKPRDSSRPPSRFEAFAEAEGHPVPEGRTLGVIRSHLALEGAEYVKDKAPDCFDRYNEAIYRAFWERSEDISDPDVLGAIAHNAGLDKAGFLNAVRARKYDAKIVRFDQDAYADDITHVPTFRFRGERCAEAPYATIREMAERFLIWYDKP